MFHEAFPNKDLQAAQLSSSTVRAMNQSPQQIGARRLARRTRLGRREDTRRNGKDEEGETVTVSDGGGDMSGKIGHGGGK